MCVGCCYRRNRLAFVQHLPAGQDVVSEVPELDGRLPQIDDAVRRRVDVREVFGGDDGEDARRRLRLARVDRPDVCVGVLAAQDGPVDQAGCCEVGPVQGAPGYLVGAVVTERTGADHVELGSRQDHVGLVLSCGQWFTPRLRLALGVIMRCWCGSQRMPRSNARRTRRYPARRAGAEGSAPAVYHQASRPMAPAGGGSLGREDECDGRTESRPAIALHVSAYWQIDRPVLPALMRSLGVGGGRQGVPVHTRSGPCCPLTPLRPRAADGSGCRLDCPAADGIAPLSWFVCKFS